MASDRFPFSGSAERRFHDDICDKLINLGRTKREVLAVVAKYFYVGLLLYVLMAGVVAAMHPSGDQVEIVTGAVFWPFSGLGLLWDQAADFYGPIWG